MTETILHGYQIVLLPRQTGAHEVVITTPDGTTRRYNEHGAKWRIGQLERELAAVKVAQEMLVAAHDGEQVSNSNGQALAIEEIK